MKDSLHVYKAFVTNVIDGDTIVVDIDLGFSMFLHDQHLRLARVNAPELKGETKDAGLASKNALASKILNHYVYVKTYKSGRDKYGRILAEIVTIEEPSLCVNDWLLAEGHAIEFMV